jgi:hypothetical protein
MSLLLTKKSNDLIIADKNYALSRANANQKHPISFYD